jgi:hypothetical protein
LARFGAAISPGGLPALMELLGQSEITRHRALLIAVELLWQL